MFVCYSPEARCYVSNQSFMNGLQVNGGLRAGLRSVTVGGHCVEMWVGTDVKLVPEND